MSGRIRVLHVIQNLNYGGMERLLHDLVVRLDPDRFDSHVLALQYLGRFARGLEAHAGLHVAEPQERWSLLWPRRLSHQIRHLSPDVVHTHSGVWYKASLAARLAGVPRLVHTEHGRQRPDPWQARLVDRLASRRTDLVVAVSEPLADDLRRRIIWGSARVVTVPNGVNTNVFRPRGGGALRRELGIGRERPIIGSVGRLEPVKAYDVMLEAFFRLRPGPGERGRERGRGRDAAAAPVLVVVGEGSERGRLESMLRARPGRSDVFLLGWRDDIHTLHADMDLFTMSSRSEGTSVSLLEAMSAGVCPIVTDVGGNATVLGPGLRHRLVPADDPRALVEAWERALRDHHGRRRDASAARTRIREAFSLERMVATYEQLYERSAASAVSAAGSPMAASINAET